MSLDDTTDIPRDAKAARNFGAEGIGLCRTEHMFFAEDRLPHVQAMILANDEKARRKALAKLLPMQRKDFSKRLVNRSSRTAAVAACWCDERHHPADFA